MAQTIEELVEMLSNMRDENQRNKDNFEKVLAGINTKLALMADDNETTDLLKLYISELKKSVDEKHSISMERFQLLDKAFEQIAHDNVQFAKTTDLKELFDSFSSSVGSFSVELASQKNILDNVRAQVEDVQTSIFNKDEIASLLNNLSASVSALGMSYNGAVADFSERFNALNYEDDLKALDGKFEVLLNSVKSVPEKISFEQLTENFKNVEKINLEIKELISQNKEELSADILTKFENLEKDFETIVTDADFAGFRANLADFIQKIIDNSSALNTQLSFGTEKLESILSSLRKLENISAKVTALDYSEDFKNVSNKLNEICELCVDSSGVKYENIIQQLNDVKQNIAETIISGKEENIENYTTLSEKLNEITLDVEFVRDLTSQKSSEILDNISKELEATTEKFEQAINSSAEINFGDIKSVLLNVVDEITQIRTELISKNDSNLYALTCSFDNLKISLENILSVLNDLSGNVAAQNAENTNKIVSDITELSSDVKGLKSEVLKLILEQNEKIAVNLSEIMPKLDEFSDALSGTMRASLFDIQENFTGFVNSLQVIQDEYVKKFDKFTEEQSRQVCNVSQEIVDLKSKVEDVVSGLKNYIEEANELNNSNKLESDNKFTEKLLDLESALIKVSDDYENKNELLQIKLAEFAKNIENSSAQTAERIILSIGDIAGLKDELAQVRESLKTSQISNDANQENLLSKFDTGIENIVVKISNLERSVKNGLDVVDALSDINDNFTRLSGYVQDYRNENLALSNDIEALLVDKFDALKEEFSLLNTDISDAVQTKTEDLTRLLEPVRLGIEEFLGFDFDNVITDIKTQLELSFMNFTVDVNGEFSTASEAICRLEQAYKDTFNKISNIEECVSEKLQNNIELLNIALETNTKMLKDSLKENIVAGVTPDGASVTQAINLIKDELAYKLEEDLVEQNNKLINSLTNVSEELKKYVDAVCQSMLSNVSLKLDVLATDPTLESLSERFDSFSDSNKNITDMLCVLNEKLDIFAMDGFEDDLGAEIDEIKDLISEQRKYLVENSNSKASLIDKYLQDMQNKLESVDLEKSSKDIKETIMNALISLVDQISFVEETEEIKDFVEEKTDEINQNLIQVQNQLRQMTNGGDDDFGYSYTLQDVESDIAKLRLAISNMSDNDFESFSDDIRKIVTSVESLESSLTQEQMSGLKNDIVKLNDDILSISSRTNKLLLTSDESYKALNDGLNNFSDIIYKLEERISCIDNSENSARIERKLDHIHSMAMESANADKVFHQVMTYLGEWIDSTTENIARISDKVDNLPQIQGELLNIQQIIPNKNSMFEELREIIPSDILKSVQNKFEVQEARIDRLEMKLDKILSTLEEKDDMVLNRKLDKLETMLSGLGRNIEKLASYVDEE